MKILEQLVLKGKLDHIRAIDMSHTASLTETAIYDFIKGRGRQLEGLMVAGKPKLAEQFFVNIIPLIKKIRYKLTIIIYSMVDATAFKSLCALLYMICKK